MDARRCSRRQMLFTLGGGLGGVALAQLLGEQGLLADPPRPDPALNGGLHHRARAKRVIQLFMNGGASQMDTFDYKPLLSRLHGQRFDPGEHVEAVTSVPGNLMQCPFPFRRHGQCGRWVSDVFPHLARHVDDVAFLLAVKSKSNVHGPASYLMNTGFILPGFPCMGAWISYGLGKLSDNLPTFVVLPDSRGLPYNNLGNFSAGFLPAAHQGTVVKLAKDEPPIRYLFPPANANYITKESERDAQTLLGELNRAHQQQIQDDTRLEARIQSYELAARMQLNTPEAFDVTKESDATQKLYGLDQPATA